MTLPPFRRDSLLPWNIRRGMESGIVAAGAVAVTKPGVALIAQGLAPIVHCNWVPVVTLKGICAALDFDSSARAVLY